MDAEPQTVTALFSPQRVTVTYLNEGTVTTPRGPCEPKFENYRDYFDCGRFPIMSDVALEAHPVGSTGFATWVPSLCLAPAPRKGDRLCTVSVLGPTEGSVVFDDVPGGDRNPTISVSFRVFKQGSGSGTVRSASLDCGRRCAIEGHFGDRETMVADAEPGSRFTGWRGMCSSAPQCSIAVGPVTSAVAVFDRADPAKHDPGVSRRVPDARGMPAPAGAAFVARLRRVAVSGHGRHRRVLMRLQLNAPATVTATLRRGRHRVAGGRWRVRRGTPLVRLRIPAGVQAGRYRLAVSLRDAAGRTTDAGRRVWLPR
jgi:hypothetical protein